MNTIMEASKSVATLPVTVNSAIGLAHYDAACAAKAVDEVQSIRAKAEAMRAYSKQAKNRQLEVDAAESTRCTRKHREASISGRDIVAPAFQILIH